MQWWENGDVELHARDKCWHCGCDLIGTGPQLFIPNGTHRRRRGHVTSAVQVCRLCLDHEEAILEARDNGWRFCEISVHEPCDCGRPYVMALGRCWQCAYERRMLDKKQRDIRFARRIIQRIRGEVRERERRRKAIDGNAAPVAVRDSGRRQARDR